MLHVHVHYALLENFRNHCLLFIMNSAKYVLYDDDVRLSRFQCLQVHFALWMAVNHSET